MAGEHDMDTTWATTITQFLSQQITDFSDAPNSILASFPMVPLDYGKESIQRIVNLIDTIAHIGKEFDVPDKKTFEETQNLDFACISDRITITRKKMANNPQGAAIHASKEPVKIRNSAEKTFVEGSSTKVIIRGVDDYPNATAGTINRPEMAYVDTLVGDYSTTSNIRTDFIESMIGLKTKKFYGPYGLLAPEITRPMFSQLLTTTSTDPVASWIQSTFGLPIIYSPFVHEAATKDDFNLFIVDLSMMSLGLTDLKIDAYYDNKDHTYYYDYELYMVPMFDPLFDGDEWLKGVARLDARDWSD